MITSEADLVERAWWVMKLPGEVIVYVPASTPEGAYAVLERNCYPGAPVRTWPILRSRWATREAVSHE